MKENYINTFCMGIIFKQPKCYKCIVCIYVLLYQVAGREKGESRRARNKGVDDDVTSVCDDVEEDPTMKRRPTKESEELKK